MIRFSIFILILLIGCTNDYKTVKINEKPFIMNSSSTFDGYYYKGSDESFDYFESKWFLTSNKKFKIKRGTYKIIKPFSINSDNEVKIDLFKTPTVFAQGASDTLYIFKNL